MQKCSRIISTIDPFAPRLQLTVFQSQKNSSTVSILLSLILGLLSILLLWNELEGMFKQSHPSVITAQTTQKSPPLYPLNQDNFTLMVYVMGSEMQILNGWNKYYNFDLRMCEKHTDPKTKQQIVNCTMIPLEECQSKHFQSKEQQTYFQSFNLTGTRCIQYEWWIANKLLIGGTLESDRYVFLDFHMYICQNSTNKQNSHTCASPEESKQALLGAFFFSHLSSNLIDFQKQGDPYSYCIKIAYTAISFEMSKSLTVKYSQTTTITDIGYITQQLDIKDTIVLKESQEISQLNNAQGLFVRLLITMDDFPQNNIRSYPKLQNIVGQLGGLVSLLFQVFNILFYPFIHSSMKYNLAHWIKSKLQNQNIDNENYSHSIVQETLTRMCDILKLTFGFNIKFNNEINIINKYLDITNIIENLIEFQTYKKLLNQFENTSSYTNQQRSLVDDAEKAHRSYQYKFKRVDQFQRRQLDENFTLRLDEEGKVQSVLVMDQNMFSNRNLSPMHSSKSPSQKLDEKIK